MKILLTFLRALARSLAVLSLPPQLVFPGSDVLLILHNSHCQIALGVLTFAPTAQHQKDKAVIHKPS
jgi:hypothetical protein